MPEPHSGVRRPEVVLAASGVYHLFELARELDARGYLKTIYSTWPWQRLRREAVGRDKVRTFPWIHTPQLVLLRRMKIPASLDREISWQVCRSFDAYIRRTLPACDVFIALSNTGLATGKHAQKRGAKYVCDRGSSHIRYQDQIIGEERQRWGLEAAVVDERLIHREEAEYAQADAITIPSEFSRRSFIEMGVPAEKLRKIPYGVRLERFSRRGAPPADRFEVMFAGSVGLRKGIPYLLQGFARLRHPHKRLRILGGIHPDLQGLLGRLPREGVEFLGHLPQPRVAEIMSTSHALVLPSIEDGFGLVMAQAMACGCPVISSHNTGGEDLFTDGEEGFHIPIRSPEAIAERLQELADDPARQERMSEAAMARVARIGGWEQYGEAWTRLIHQLTERMPQVSVPSAVVPDTSRGG